MEQIKSLFVAMLCGFALLIASCIIFREWPIVVVFAIGGSFFVARWVYSKMLERYGVIPVSKWQVEQYNPETHVFKIVGIEHNIGKKYVAENIDHIKECARLSRENGRSKDPHAVSLVVDGRVVGYISRAYSYIIAPVLDANPDAAVLDQVAEHLYIISSCLVSFGDRDICECFGCALVTRPRRGLHLPSVFLHHRAGARREPRCSRFGARLGPERIGGGLRALHRPRGGRDP